MASRLHHNRPFNLISAVIITYNEERNIGRCLESLAGVVDEVIIIDSYSTDRTEKICVDHGATFIQREWQGYSKTKNKGNAMANNEFILSIDADEAISPELKAAIQDAKESGLSGAYGFNRLTNYCGKWIHHCGWYPDKKIRLFPKDLAKWEGDHVHEELVLNEEVDNRWLKGDLHHFSYYTTIEHRERALKYARLGAKKLINWRGLGVKLLFSPAFRFIQMFILQRGFLDGKAGFDICRITSWEVAQKYKLAIRAKHA